MSNEILIIILGVFAIIILIAFEDKGKNTGPEAAETTAKASEEPYRDPYAEALMEKTEKSIMLNLAALEAYRKMYNMYNSATGRDSHRMDLAELEDLENLED